MAKARCVQMLRLFFKWCSVPCGFFLPWTKIISKGDQWFISHWIPKRRLSVCVEKTSCSARSYKKTVPSFSVCFFPRDKYKLCNVKRRGIQDMPLSFPYFLYNLTYINQFFFFNLSIVSTFVLYWELWQVEQRFVSVLFSWTDYFKRGLMVHFSLDT